MFLRVASKILAEWPRPRIGIDLANLGEILSDLANFKIGDLDLTFKNVTSRDLAPPFQGPSNIIFFPPAQIIENIGSVGNRKQATY